MVISYKPSTPMITLGGAVAITATLLSSAGWSLTPEQVWTKLQELGTDAGQTVRAASEQAGPGTLTLDGITFTTETGAGTGSSMLIDGLTLTAQDDGSVQIDKTGRYQIVVEYGSESGIDRSVIEVIDTDVGIVATGTADEMTLSYTADTFELRFVEMTAASGIPAPDISLSAKGVRSETRYGTDSTSTDAHAATMNFDFAFADPDSNSTIELAYQMSELDLSSTGQIADMPLIGDELVPFDVAIDYEAFSLGAGVASPNGNDTLALSGEIKR